MSQYFAKYLRVKGKIFNGCMAFKPEIFYEGVKMSDEYVEEVDGLEIEVQDTKNYVLAQLFLCSKDIKIGDIVLDTKTGLDHGVCADIADGKYLYNEHDHYSTIENSFKVIGKLSREAIWVSEGDEFYEDEWRFVTYDHGIVPIVMPKDSLYPDYPVNIEILGPCGHFH